MIFTDADKLKVAQREIKKREQVYARLIAKGKMSASQAAYEIAGMTAIAADYEERVAVEKRETELAL